MISDNLPVPDNFAENTDQEESQAEGQISSNNQEEEIIKDSESITDSAEPEGAIPEEKSDEEEAQHEQEEESAESLEEVQEEVSGEEASSESVETASEEMSPQEEQETDEQSEARTPVEPDSSESDAEETGAVEAEATSEADSEVESEGTEEEGEPVRENLQWYVVKVQSGREDSIKEAIERRVKIDGLEEFFGQVFIPTEEVVEMRRGKRVTRVAKKLPGYIMAQVEFNDEILYLFRETSGVGDFVGGTLERPPSPMTPDEIRHWMGEKALVDDEGEEDTSKKQKQKENIPYSVGERVMVKTGMFNGMEGEITEIDYEKGTIHVEVTIFGRGVDAELEHWNVEPTS